MPKAVDLIDQEFGRLKVLGFSHRALGRRYWLCLCSCGATTLVITSSLRRKNGTASCGCLHAEIFRKSTTKHGFRRRGLRDRTYHIWMGMHYRCNNPRDEHYYQKGIRVCNRWKSFENFLADMGSCPSGLTIDRIRGKESYAPGNCRWASMKTQRRNQERTRLFTFNGKTQTLPEWAEEVGKPYGRLQLRLYRGWTIEQVLTRPLRKVNYRTEEELILQRQAKDAVHNAVRAGKLKKPSCCQYPDCQESKLQAHHYLGYAPEHFLDVEWYCLQHHVLVGQGWSETISTGAR